MRKCELCGLDIRTECTCVMETCFQSDHLTHNGGDLYDIAAETAVDDFDESDEAREIEDANRTELEQNYQSEKENEL